MYKGKSNHSEDKMLGKIIGNQKGGTIIGILIALAIIGVLAHPKYSPFRHQYYAFVTKSDLKSLHKECKKFWAFNISNGSTGDSAGDFDVAMSADVFTSKVKGGTNDSGSCNLESVSKTPFQFSKNSNISIAIDDGSPDSFQATAKHASGDKTFKITASGGVVEG